MRSQVPSQPGSDAGLPLPPAPATTKRAVLPRALVVKFRDELLGRSPVTAGEFHSAMRYAENQRVPLQDALVALSYVPERLAYEALSAASGIPLIDLEQTHISPLAVRLVPERVARRHAALALAEDNRTLTYATAQPFNPETDQDVSFASGRQARPALARPTQLAAALDRFYPRVGDIDRLLARFRTRVGAISDAAQRPRNTSPIVELCDQIITGAVAAHASDVHIEPLADGALVRFRIDGILENVFTVPHEAVPAMTNRFKILGKTDIATRHRPQDGAFTVPVEEREVFVRLSTIPTVHGEKIVLRVIDGEHRLVTLDALGYEPEAAERLRRALDRPDGLVLVTGPTGSGKTTALYAALAYLRDGRRSIVSVEDPVERRIDGVNQIPVNIAAGASFAAVLKSVLRQDPNVLMVGEVRDNEVAQIVGQAAYTGHLVLTSMHTADAASAMTRLMNLGLEPYKVAESLTAVVAQRLVRRLCPHCSVAADSGDRQEAPQAVTQRRRPGSGCKQCKLTGYIDRIAVAEVFTPTEALRTAIAKGMTALELRQAMKEAGHRFMRDAALRLVDEGITSLDEVNRVLAEHEDDSDRTRAAGSGKRQVLVVDDDRMIRMLVKVLLQREGYDVLEAENGREALDMAQCHRPDLLITDLVMPEVDGYQTLTALRADGGFSRLPVIVLTAETGPEVERTVLDLGADDYLVKPFEADVLVQRVRSVFVRQMPLAG
jgi:type II secretory ATPase GspE/PulE/Tfp pilus assembly ATPase PilB-like protein/ActR/RegA family two-component response regulator